MLPQAWAALTKRGVALRARLLKACSRRACVRALRACVRCVQILSNFGMDVMEALSGTCTLWVAGRRTTAQLACDLVVAWGVVITHALTLMCEVRAP